MDDERHLRRSRGMGISLVVYTKGQHTTISTVWQLEKKNRTHKSSIVKSDEICTSICTEKLLQKRPEKFWSNK